MGPVRGERLREILLWFACALALARGHTGAIRATVMLQWLRVGKGLTWFAIASSGLLGVRCETKVAKSSSRPGIRQARWAGWLAPEAGI